MFFQLLADFFILAFCLQTIFGRSKFFDTLGVLFRNALGDYMWLPYKVYRFKGAKLSILANPYVENAVKLRMQYTSKDSLWWSKDHHIVFKSYAEARKLMKLAIDDCKEYLRPFTK